MVVTIICISIFISLAVYFLARPKRVYKVTWSYGDLSNYTYTELVRARDMVSAWKKITRQHYLAINCQAIEKFEEY